MKTRSRLPRLCSIVCVGTIVGLALCASAFAGPEGKNVVMPPKYQVAQKRVIYYVRTSASAIPQPIERLGGIPTTTVPIQVIGDPRISNQGP